MSAESYQDLQHREAQLRHALAAVERERNALRDEVKRLRAVAKLASSEHHPPAHVDASP